jgi:hypothetical protein
MGNVDLGKCAARVHGSWFGGRPCRRDASTLHNGQGYCKQHNPENVKAKREAADAGYKSERDRQAAIQERRNQTYGVAKAAQDYVDALPSGDQKAIDAFLHNLKIEVKALRGMK